MLIDGFIGHNWVHTVDLQSGDERRLDHVAVGETATKPTTNSIDYTPWPMRKQTDCSIQRLHRRKRTSLPIRFSWNAARTR